MSGAKRSARRKYMAAVAEAARLARHARRFSADALRARALGKAERELIRNTVRHYALRGMRITVDGYATLKAKARAEVAAGSFPPVI